MFNNIFWATLFDNPFKSQNFLIGQKSIKKLTLHQNIKINFIQ